MDRHERFAGRGDALRDLCSCVPDEYFLKVDDRRGYPEEFIRALTGGRLDVGYDPKEDGGTGMSLAEASFKATNACLQTHGGFGLAAQDRVQRKFCKMCLYQVAPISTKQIFSYVAEHILGLPRSF